MQARDYQKQILDNIFEAYDRGINSGVVRGFTGSGKSFLSTEFARLWKERVGGKVLFLVDQIDLAYQAHATYKRQFPNLKIGMEMSSENTSDDHDIMIASVQTLSKKGSKRIEKFNPDDYTAVLCDEAHRSVTPSWERVLHYMGVHPENFIEGKILIGLTATPRRRGNTGLGKLYHDFYANFDIIYGMREGWLVTPEWIKVKTDLDISKVKVKGDFFDEEELAEIINNEVRNKLIFKAWDDEGRGQAIVYCQSVEHAYDVAQMFKAEGVRAETIEANTNKDNRKDWLKEFKHGNLEVLTNFGTLSTGVDFPELRSIVFARPIGSDVLYEQILGRVLRPSQFAMVDAMPTAELRKAAIAVSEKPYAKVIDLVDTTGAVRLMNPLTLLGVNEKVKTDDKVKVFEQVYEPLERAKKQHGIDISEITDLGEIETIVTRSKGIDITAPKATELYTMSELKWFKVGENEYELISTKENKTLVVTENEVGRWELSEYDMKSTSGMGKILNSFNTLAGALRVADEYVESFADYRYLRRNAHQAEKPPTEKQINFIKRLFGRSVQMLGDKVIIRGWGKRPDVHVNTVEDAADIITKRLGK